MVASGNEARIRRLLYAEVLWSSVLGGVAAFNAVYLLRLGGTNFDVSLNSALPSLGAVLISVPAGHFLQSRATEMVGTSLQIRAQGDGLAGWKASCLRRNMPRAT